MEESAGIVGETVGAYVEIGGADSDTGSMDDLDEIPQYLLQAGCSASVENESPLEFLSLLLFTHNMLEHIVSVGMSLHVVTGRWHGALYKSPAVT